MVQSTWWAGFLQPVTSLTMLNNTSYRYRQSTGPTAWTANDLGFTWSVGTRTPGLTHPYWCPGRTGPTGQTNQPRQVSPRTKAVTCGETKSPPLVNQTDQVTTSSSWTCGVGTPRGAPRRPGASRAACRRLRRDARSPEKPPGPSAVTCRDVSDWGRTPRSYSPAVRRAGGYIAPIRFPAPTCDCATAPTMTPFPKRH